MRDDRIDAQRRRLLLFGLLSPLALMAIGCAGGARKRTGRLGLTRALGTTIGRNLGDAPAGQSIPASGLGVDLVSGSSERVQIDGALGSASPNESGNRSRTK